MYYQRNSVEIAWTGWRFTDYWSRSLCGWQGRAAVATGRGEECVRACGSFLVVEMMAQGKSPQEACEYAAKRIIKLNLLSHKNRDHDYQVGFVAINSAGDYGAASVR